MSTIAGIILALAGGWMLAQNTATRVGGPLLTVGVVLLVARFLL